MRRSLRLWVWLYQLTMSLLDSAGATSVIWESAISPSVVSTLCWSTKMADFCCLITKASLGLWFCSIEATRSRMIRPPYRSGELSLLLYWSTSRIRRRWSLSLKRANWSAVADCFYIDIFLFAGKKSMSFEITMREDVFTYLKLDRIPKSKNVSLIEANF